MSPVLSCAWTTDLMTDYLEGALPFHKLAGVKLHLGICPRCRAFLASLKSLPTLVRAAMSEPAVESPSALLRAMARIEAGEAKVPLHHPAGSFCAALKDGSADETLRMVAGVHLDHCPSCQRENPGPERERPTTGGALPAWLRARVKPETEWSWVRHGLRGAKVAEIFKDSATGSRLWLSFLPTRARFPDHVHDGLEAAVVLDGWVQDGPVLAGPGDCIMHERGSEHDPQAEGADGCWILARTGPEGLRFSGWRGLFG